MVYGYTVKYNGVYYAAGMNVPNDKEEPKKPEPEFFAEEAEEQPKKKGRPKKEL